eukprot:gene551-695_t
MFIYYFLYQLRINSKTNQSIVFHSIHNNLIIVFSIINGVPNTLVFHPKEIDRISSFLSTDDAFYIIDSVHSKDIIACSTRKLFVSSPYPNVYKDVTKQDRTIMYMDIWKFNEIMELKRNINGFTNIPDKYVRYLFDMWGGIPRQVLTNWKSNLEKNTNVLDDAINTMTVDQIARFVGTSSAEDFITNKILHIKVIDGEKNEWSAKKIIFGSPYIRRRVVTTLLETTHKSQIISQLRSFDFRHTSNGGAFFEQICHSILSQGGNFKYRKLSLYALNESQDCESNIIRNLTIKYELNDHIKVFDSHQAHQIKSGEYSIPSSSNFPGINSIIKGTPTMMFQMTVSLVHEISFKKFSKFLEEGKFPSPLEIYFVVPPDIFPKMVTQKLKKSPEAIPGPI